VLNQRFQRAGVVKMTVGHDDGGGASVAPKAVLDRFDDGFS
jgi:hypothetical protein